MNANGPAGRRATRPVVVLVSLLVMALAVSIGWLVGTARPDARPALTSALDALPSRTTVVGFTDWARVRDRIGLTEVDTRSERTTLVTAASKRDLTTRSLFRRDVEVMHSELGWSAADIEWEVFGQDPVGDESVVRLDDSISFDGLRDRLDDAGYARRGSIWRASEGTHRLPAILANVALVPRQRLVVMSDRPQQVPGVLDVIHGRAPSLAASHAAADTARALAGTDSVILQAKTLGCDTTAVTRDAEVQQQARAAVERVGSLETYRFSGRAIADRGGSGFSAQRLIFAMTFGSATEASEQADVRARLTDGPFIGRTGTMDETLRLRSAGADEGTVRLEFAHDPRTDVFMTGTGPVLFASC